MASLRTRSSETDFIKISRFVRVTFPFPSRLSHFGSFHQLYALNMKLKSVLISDDLDHRCLEILLQGGIKAVVDTKLRLDKEKFKTEIAKYDGLIVRSATKVTADIIEAATNLKIIGRAGTGVDNIDCDAASRRGIVVMNTPGGNTLSAAEHTCALICSLSRDIPNAVATMKEGKWERSKFMGNELHGKTLAIIGLGRIGKEVALRMQSFGMKTIGYDPIIPASVSSQFGVDSLELEKIWPQADYITVHTPLIPQTANLINEAVFAKCKKGVKVVNCARGGIIDEEALLKALDNGQCGGAGLDVFINEPPTDYRLAQHPKVIATPHLGASTVEAQKRVAIEIAEQFLDAMNGKSFFGAINAQALQHTLNKSTQPWVDLGTSIGKILASISDAKSGLTVQVYGKDLKDGCSYLGAAVLCGLLKPSGAGDSVNINLVSAPALAEQMGIKVEVKFEVLKVPYEEMIMVFWGGNFITGTVLGDRPSIISMSGGQFSAPAVLSGHMLFFKAEASVDLIPRIAGVLTTNGAVITGFSVTPDVKKSQWGIVYLNSPAPDGLFQILTVAEKACSANF